MLNSTRLSKAQASMRTHGIDAYMVLTHDDYVYFFGEDRFQPRAIVPAQGQPIIVGFRGEEEDIRESLGAENVKIFSTVGQQIKDVVETMRQLWTPGGAERKMKVGIQMGFFTPYFLVNMFQKANPQIEVVDIAPVMDPLRMEKDTAEIELIQQACNIAEIGMRAALDHLRPGVTEHAIATEILYATQKAGAGGTAVPVFVNSGKRSCWLHGTATDKIIKANESVIINIVPRYRGYCANLCRTFVLGEADEKLARMHQVYLEAQEATVNAMRPGIKVRELDEAAKVVFERHGFGEYFVPGISHSIGLMFEETPMPTIHPNHNNLNLVPDMAITAGHSVLAISGFAGVRNEDTYHLTTTGATAMTRFPKTMLI